MSKNLTSWVATAIIILVSSTSYAAPVVLDFEGVGNESSIEDFYNGGTDSTGNSGTDYGVEFSGNTLGIVDRDAGGTGNFANEPSPNTIMFWLTGGSSVLNYGAGFDTGFSFFYTSSVAASIDVYSEVDATGDLLGSLELSAQHTDDCTGDPLGTFCNWDPIGVSFAGVARSIDFSGTANYTGYDDVTFGSATAGGGDGGSNGDGATEVPEPASLLLLGLGLLGLRRFSKA